MSGARTLALLACGALAALTGPANAQRPGTWRCKRLLAEDGRSWREDVVVVTLLSDIVAIEPASRHEAVDRDFGDAWVIPGLIDLHTHLLLKPYDQMAWDDQVLRETTELRTLRARVHGIDTLQAGFVAVRDLGTEGAGFADVALQRAIAEGLATGPRIWTSTRAIVRRGWYGPSPDDPAVPKGAQTVEGEAEIRDAVRAQAAGGAQWIKVYADSRKQKGGVAEPTFALAELAALVDEATKAGLPVAAHATTDEGIRRAVLAGARTIEHGGGASAATLRAMRERAVVLVPCLAANEAIVLQAGRKGPIVERLNAGKAGFPRALAAGVTVGCGSDAGVFRHGDNARELELMVAYGMTPAQALASATTGAADVLGAKDLGVVRAGARCGLVVLGADPLVDIGALRQVRAVEREGDELLMRRDGR
ncbi:MAG: amidohydrolase family protein [Planctomycetota bacterium]